MPLANKLRNTKFTISTDTPVWKNLVSRREQVVLLRFRINYTRLNHNYFFGSHHRPFYEACYMTLSVVHIKFHRIHENLSISLDSLTTVSDFLNVMNFLYQTGFFIFSCSFFSSVVLQTLLLYTQHWKKTKKKRYTYIYIYIIILFKFRCNYPEMKTKTHRKLFFIRKTKIMNVVLFIR